jgi:sarcosine oxidase subunit alpha
MVLDETGVVVDDGVAARLGENHFFVTASTTGAEQMYPTFLWHQAQWRLDVDIADVTAAMCAFNLAGPRSRTVLEKLDSDMDFSSAAFSYMAVRMGRLEGIPVRILRIGFVGELGYEIHAPSAQAEALWDALIEAGAESGIRPFAVEAQRVLRLEKGHIIVGQDTDGLTNPLEADMGWALGRRKPYYVGKRSIDIAASKGNTRKLVGYGLTNSDDPVPEEGHLVIRGGDIVGRVTSSARSPTLGRAIGLGYVAPDQAGTGQIFNIKAHGGRMLQAEVMPLPFYDPNNTRQDF